METATYSKIVVIVKKDQNGSFGYYAEPKYPDDPELDFEKKVIHVRDGNESIKLWLGALQGHMVINSLAATIKKHQIEHQVDLDGNVLETIFDLLSVCTAHKLVFNAVVQILLEVKLRRIAYVDHMEDTDLPDLITIDAHERGGLNLDTVDFRLDPRRAFTYIAITGFCNELLTPTNNEMFVEETILVIEDIDLRQSTSILQRVNIEKINQKKFHQQVDKVDGTTCYTVYVPLFPHSETALWGCGQCYGPRRESYPSEMHGYNDRSNAVGLVASTSMKTAPTSAPLTGEPALRRKEYTYTLVHTVPQDYEPAGEMRGATWMDCDVVHQQVVQWLASAGLFSGHVILRTLRMKIHKATNDKKSKSRYISFPVFTVYFPTGRHSARLHEMVGLAGRTPASQPSKTSSKSDTTWTLVAIRSAPTIRRDFLVVPLHLPFRQILFGKTMLDLGNAKATERMFRVTGVHIGPLSNTNWEKLCNLLPQMVDLYRGLAPSSIFLAPSNTHQGEYKAGSCELIIIQDEFIPLPTEISQITAAIEEFAYNPSMGITAVPFAGTYRGDSSLYKPNMGSMEVDGTEILLPVDYKLFRHLPWGQEVNTESASLAKDADIVTDQPGAKVPNSILVNQSGMLVTRGSSNKKHESRLDLSAILTSSSNPSSSGPVASRAVGTRSMDPTSKTSVTKAPPVSNITNTRGNVARHQVNPTSGGSDNSGLPLDATGARISDVQQSPPMDTEDDSVTESDKSVVMDEASGSSDDEDLLNEMNAKAKADQASRTRSAAGLNNTAPPGNEHVPPEADSPLKRLRSTTSKPSSRRNSSVAPPSLPAKADQMNVG